jgi:hypothetical protein
MPNFPVKMRLLSTTATRFPQQPREWERKEWIRRSVNFAERLPPRKLLDPATWCFDTCSTIIVCCDPVLSATKRFYSYAIFSPATHHKSLAISGRWPEMTRAQPTEANLHLFQSCVYSVCY